MIGTPYTLAMWKVRPGKAAEFEAAWKDLADIFSSLRHPPVEGTLLRSQADPQLYYSFGPWRSDADVAAMRADAKAQAGLARLQALCDEATPGAYHVVMHVTV